MDLQAQSGQVNYAFCVASFIFTFLRVCVFLGHGKLTYQRRKNVVTKAH